jgi:acyl carrier protein
MDRATATAQLQDILEHNFQIERNDVTEAKTFKDLGLDAREFHEMILAMEEQFRIPIDDEEAHSIVTVRHALDLIVNKTGG